MAKRSNDYPSFTVFDFEEMRPLRVVVVLLWFLIAFSLAHLYFFFAKRPALLDPLLNEWVLGDERGQFVMDYLLTIGAGILYTVGFAWWGVRSNPNLDMGRALRLMAPGLAGSLLYLLFVYADAPNFSTSLAAWILPFFPPFLALFWPIWSMKLLRGATWEEWSPKVRRGALLLLGGAAGLVFANGTGAALRKWAVMEHNLQDMGLYVQMVWGGTQGKVLHNTGYWLPNDNFLNGEHAIFSTMLLTPLGYLPDISLGLVLAQALMFLGSALLVAAIARHHSRLPWVPPFFALLFVLTPWVERGLLDDFHIDAFEVFLFLLAWWIATAMEGITRWIAFLATVLALLGCKEDAGLTVGMMGLALMVQGRTRWLGLAAFLLGPSYTVMVIHGLMPSNVHFGKYSHLGEGSAGVAKTFLTRPDIVLGELWLTERRLSLLRLLLCFGLLPLLAPEIWLILAAPVATTLLSNWEKQFKLETHYGLDFLGPLAVAALVGWGRLESFTAFISRAEADETLASRAQRRLMLRSQGRDLDAEEQAQWSENRSEFGWRMTVLAAGALILALYVHHDYAKHSVFHPMRWLSSMPMDPRLKDFEREVAAHIGPAEGVCTQNDLGPVFAGREFIIGFPPYRDAEGKLIAPDRLDVVLVDALGELTWADGKTAELVDEFIRDHGFKVHHYWQGYLILRRTESPLDSDEQQAALADFGRRLAGRR